jgi:penicillin-binding protein 1A
MLDSALPGNPGSGTLAPIIATGRAEIKSDFLSPARRRRLGIAAAILAASAIAGAATGTWLRLDLPSVRRLEDYRPPLITRLLDDGGDLLYQFAEERRVLIGASDLAPHLRAAILAAEDPRFYRHVGVDPQAIARAALKDLLTFSKAEGASTITQQLARSLFLTPTKLWRRKIQEAMLALEMERVYTKEEILGFYVNQIYLGHGRYGFEVAARFYFGHGARDVTLAEAALLAGLAQRPEALSPFRSAEAALRRRNHVLDRMAVEGFVDAAEAEAAKGEPLVLAAPQPAPTEAPYFVEEVRRDLAERYGEAALYEEGLEVRTTLDARLQAAANRALVRGLHDLDKRIGWRGPERNLVDDGEDLDAFDHPAWAAPPQPGDRLPALVLDAGRGTATVRVGTSVTSLDGQAVAWTGQDDPARLLRRGDLIRVEVARAAGGRLSLTLDQVPEVEGALVAIEPATGEVKAMVGGYDFSRSQFNRATQAQRQAGSAFKPFVYAAALYGGLTPADAVFDEPTLLVDRTTGAVYQPNNYDRDYNGVVTLRQGLEGSLNIATVRLLNAIGYEPVIRVARRMGIASPLPPYPSLALGAAEINLLELTSAYTAFPNQGVRVEPHWIRAVLEHDGATREQARPAAGEALRPDVAYVMVAMFEGAVERGTAKLARGLGRPVGGKTGTTDDYTDAWFVGFTPSLAAGVWVGYDQKRTLGARETGARAALPIWLDFMRDALAGSPVELFHPPANVVRVPIDRRTGLRAGLDTGCDDVILESFLEGTAPTASCSPEEHRRAGLPYYLQRYPLDDLGRLRLTPRDLDWLTRWQGCRIDGGFGPRRLTCEAEGARASLPVEIDAAPAGEAIPYPERLVDRQGVHYQDDVAVPPGPDAAASKPADPLLDESAFRRWQGLDGRDAVVIYVRRDGAADPVRTRAGS